MKILVISDMYPKKPGDTSGTFVQSQVSALHAKGADVHVICPYPKLRSYKTVFYDVLHTSAESTVDVINEVPVSYITYWNVPLKLSVNFVIDQLFKSLLNIVNQIEQTWSFDVIHVHRLFPIGYVAMRIAHEKEVPVVVTCHGSDVHTNPQKNDKFYYYTVETIKGVDAVIAVSDYLSKQIKKMSLKTSNISTIYNGINTTHFKPINNKLQLRKDLKLPHKGVGMCCVCRLVREKGLFELLEAMHHLHLLHPSLFLYIIGDGPDFQKLNNDIIYRGLEKSIFLMGASAPENVPQWMQAADLFVLPSYNQGFGCVLMEAMGCGVPVIASSVGGIPELIKNDENGLLIPVKQSTHIVSAVDRLITDGDLRQRIALKGLQTVREKFQWSQCADELIQKYKLLC